MISGKLQIAMLIAIGLYFLIVFHLLKRRSLNLKYTLLWLFSGVIMLVLAIFPKILSWLAALVGIYEPTNALFALMFFCVIIILMSLTAIVSKLNEKSKRVIQTLALMEKRVRDLEEKENETQQSVCGDENQDRKMLE